MKQNDPEREPIQTQLNQELITIQFKQQYLVLRRTHPVTMMDHLRKWWNKELNISVLPITCCTALLFGGIIFWTVDQSLINEPRPEQRQMVDTGASIYWNDIVERSQPK